jgi:uncharacterized protein with HEPN domain
MPRKGPHDVSGDQDRFEHTLEAARDAMAFVRGRKREDLDHDAMLRRGVVNCVQVIGEAAARTTQFGRRRAPGLPWPDRASLPVYGALPFPRIDKYTLATVQRHSCTDRSWPWRSGRCD